MAGGVQGKAPCGGFQRGRRPLWSGAWLYLPRIVVHTSHRFLLKNLTMLELTPEAIKKLEELIKEQTTDPEMAIRVSVHLSVPKRLDLVLDKEKRDDHVVRNEKGVKVLLIQSAIVHKLEGLVLDYQKTPDGEGFTILRPTFH